MKPIAPCDESSGKRFAPEYAGELIPTRQSLLSRLRNWSDEESWNEFFDTYWRLIYGAALHAGLTDAEAQDVVQETLIAVSKRMPTFHYKAEHGSFKSWLLCLTRWRIADQLRQRGAHKSRGRDECDTDTPSEMAEPAAHQSSAEFETMWDEEWEKWLRTEVLERVKRKVNPRMYQIFDLHVLQRCPVERVARFVKANRAYIYLSTQRVGRLIRTEIKYLKSKPI